LPQAEFATLGKLLIKAFEAGCAALTEAHAALNALDQENARVLATRLVLPEGAAEQYEAERKAYEALHRWAWHGVVWQATWQGFGCIKLGCSPPSSGSGRVR
jgi:hypothetical protein